MYETTPSLVIQSFIWVTGLRCQVDENCVLLGCYAASSGNFLPMFRDNLSVPSSRVKNPKRKPGTLVGGLCREVFY